MGNLAALVPVALFLAFFQRLLLGFDDFVNLFVDFGHFCIGNVVIVGMNFSESQKAVLVSAEEPPSPDDDFEHPTILAASIVVISAAAVMR